MIRNESRLRQIDLRWERAAYYDLSFVEAFDLAIARTINGLPPAAEPERHEP